MDNFLYNNKTYRIIEILKIKNIDFVIYLNSSFQYAYLVRKMEEDISYLPIEEVITENFSSKRFYQNIQSLLDAYVFMLNQNKDIRYLNYVLQKILIREEKYFEIENYYGISKDYFVTLFALESITYHKKSMEELLEIKISDKIEEKVEPTTTVKFPFAKFAYMVLIAFSAICFMEFYSIYANWKTEGKETKKLASDLVAETTKEEVEEEFYIPIEEEFGVAEDTKTPTDVVKKEKYGKDYWNYMKVPMISVDFDKLKKENSDTVGWLFVNNTNINYPIVQTSNNTYYLNKAFDRTRNAAGWIFADYRSDLKNFKKNTVIYGHGRVDQVMFGSLDKTLKKSWYTNKENQIIKLSTPTQNTLWQIISIYTIDAEAYYLTHNFENDESYQKFLNTIVARSKYDFKANVSTNDKILTLSTCLNYEGERIVIHAKLVQSKAK